MIRSLSVRNFQSLHEVDLDLAALTVIVGPSSSGKSSLTRALRTLTANARGSAFISTWAKRTTISATTDKGTVTLTRGTKTDDNSYVVTGTAAGEDFEQTYTKLGGTVPPEVSAFLGIDLTDPLRSPGLHYAAQFDRPYLLADSSSEVARTLAALTNVDVVFSAAREANRSRLDTSRTLKVRTEDLQRTTEQVETFEDLKIHLPALDRAETTLTAARGTRTTLDALQAITVRLDRAAATHTRVTPILARPIPDITRAEKIHALIGLITAAEARLTRAEQTITRTATSLARPIPSAEPAVRAADALGALDTTISRLKTAQARCKASDALLTRTLDDEVGATERYHTALTEAGQCPTCGQDTTDIKNLHPSHSPELTGAHR